MNTGYCTNLPSACAKAASKEPIPMSAPDSRCPECGSGLISAKLDSSGSHRKFILLGIILLAMLLGGGYLIKSMFFGGSEIKPDQNQQVPIAPVTPKASTPIAVPVSTELRLSGSNTIGAALAPQLVTAWLLSKGATDVSSVQRQKDGLPIHETLVSGKVGDKVFGVEIRAHGSGDAFKHLGYGSADIGMSSRPIKSEEKAALAALSDMSGRSSEHVIGLDGIAVIVAPGNALSGISRQDLARIFTCEVTNWSQIGSGSGAIHVYARDDKSGTYDTFKTLVLGNGALVAGARRHEDSAELEAAVARDPAAIGFVGLPYVRTARAVPVSDSRKTAPLSPTVFTIRKEDYPLARRLFLYTAANPANPYVGEFVRFTQSDAGQQVVKAVGFVDQTINMAQARPGQSADRSCMMSSQWPGPKDAYCKLTASKSDLGTNFRFRTGSAELDNRAAQDLQRVLKLMADGGNRRLTLVGFADSQGNYGTNRTLSESRANAIKAALQTLGITSVESYGFGQEIPIADNDAPDGRERNRRVEIWVNN